MRLLNYIYCCGQCQSEFRVPQIPDTSYGEFILRTERGEVSYLSAIDSDDFSEVSGMIATFLKGKGISELGRAQVLHQIFGIACDLSPGGYVYKIGEHPLCPECGNNNMHSWKPTDPPEIVELDLPSVTHDEWNSLAIFEKRSRVEKAVDEVLKRRRELRII